MKALTGILCGFVATLGGGAVLAHPAASGDERAFIGATWSGGDPEEVEGYESYGGSYVADPLAVSLFRSQANASDWIVVSKREVGRTGQHALWRGLDTIRVTAPAGNHVAFECRRASQTAGEFAPEPGLLGFVGDAEANPGFLRAGLAIQVGADGRLTRVNEPVVCVDEGAGI